MTRIVTPIVSALMLSALAPTAAQAQLFWKPTPLGGAGTPVVYTSDIPAGTPEEQRAAATWHLRAALNVAALQCDFEPTLLTVSNYNAAIAHHKAELAKAFDTLGSYFQRTAGAGKPGQTALDKYGTRIYSGYSAVQAQRAFCSMAAQVGREAIFAPRGALGDVALRRLPDIRRGLAGQGEQFFQNPVYGYRATLPSLKGGCWSGDALKDNCRAQWSRATPAPRGG